MYSTLGLRLSPLSIYRKFTMKGNINTQVSSEMTEPYILHATFEPRLFPSTIMQLHDISPIMQPHDISPIMQPHDISPIKLKNLLENNQEVQAIKVEMAKIQAKKYITVKQFSEIYNISKTAQQGFRGRLRDPLPSRQTVPRGKITYVVKEVEEWFGNQYK